MLKGEQTFDIRDNHYSPAVAAESADPDSPVRSFAGKDNATKIRAEQRPAKRPSGAPSRPVEHCLPQQSDTELATPQKLTKRPTHPPQERAEPVVGKRQTQPVVADTLDVGGLNNDGSHQDHGAQPARTCIRINGPWPVKEQVALPVDRNYKVTPPWHTES
uniref:Uncharacterized protein n=1 Tax=Neobodo designis TaxID=312471 RepID=A0A7S1M2P3_NEODS|mmetsp:Transcript_33141/g.102317  ORF Transcript_33141/g.102317 Transcript_33141/m.102317 type:complete len:161 (+) Transcript_33141:53-535(+)